MDAFETLLNQHLKEFDLNHVQQYKEATEQLGLIFDKLEDRELVKLMENCMYGLEMAAAAEFYRKGFNDAVSLLIERNK